MLQARQKAGDVETIFYKRSEQQNAPVKQPEE